MQSDCPCTGTQVDDEEEEDRVPSRCRRQAPVNNEELDDDEGLRVADSPQSVTMRYFALVRNRLRLELSSRRDGLVECWLQKHLEQNMFWLHASAARMVLRRLGVDLEDFKPEYIRDLCVWLPHVQYGHLPPCPACAGSACP